MGKSILVIGAGGNVGREVVRHLAARGATARAAVSRADTPRQPNVAAETVLFDFLDPDTFPAAFDGVERMFLLRPPAISNVKRDILPAIEYAAVAGVRQIAFLSLVGAEHNRFVPHAKIETVLKGSGIPWTMLRCGFFMQNLNTIHRADIVEHDDLFIPGGHGATSFIDVRDIGAAAARTLTEPGHEGRAYDLTGQETLTYGEVAAIMTQELGRPITYSNPSVFSFARRMRRRGHSWNYIWVMEGIYLTTRLGLAATLAPDVELLLERPPATMRQYVRDYPAAFAPES